MDVPGIPEIACRHIGRVRFSGRKPGLRELQVEPAAAPGGELDEIHFKGRILKRGGEALVQVLEPHLVLIGLPRIRTPLIPDHAAHGERRVGRDHTVVELARRRRPGLDARSAPARVDDCNRNVELVVEFERIVERDGRKVAELVRRREARGRHLLPGGAEREVRRHGLVARVLHEADVVMAR